MEEDLVILFVHWTAFLVLKGKSVIRISIKYKSYIRPWGLWGGGCSFKIVCIPLPYGALHREIGTFKVGTLCVA